MYSDEAKGCVGQNPAHCNSCWDIQKIVVNSVCEACQVRTAFQVDRCVCDNLNGFVGVSPNLCEDCWGNQKAISGQSCQVCPLNSIFKVDKCVCDESKGFAEQDPAHCSCWDEQKVIINWVCKVCQIHTVFQVDHCVCDVQTGFVGSNQCEDCWGAHKVISGQSCQDCPFGSVFKVDKCVCDEDQGFVGQDPASWTDSMVLIDSECTLCSDNDTYSVYDTENLCKCEENYAISQEGVQNFLRNQPQSYLFVFHYSSQSSWYLWYQRKNKRRKHKQSPCPKQTDKK
ncbi:Growth_factor receptor cysteine-rich domain superfamily [Hexamita inflata]|uniref:Growth factor receptor cysteine-rich domain superfamily n=1 Tax=Hexamita inflata TaxID=28002 RepID=A0AA86RMM4_9EUKA|nr:Growth factor receptor cysteine-rich domain superfamily [Hexamita inflata]